uniref:C2 domain-containing protein n=1 Tax=Oncorhynchus tshawytscha TaxID=74940 RepID=A0A8C8HWI5_ONCTS
MLRVVVESAKGLPKNKLGSTPDPVASIIFKDEKKKTKSIDSEVNPVWNEVLQFDLKGSALDSSSYIDVIVKDYETIGKDKFLGSAKISLKDLATGQVKSSPSHDVALVNEKGQAIGATVSLLIRYDPPANAAPKPNDPQEGATAGDSVEGGGEERDEDFIDVGQSGYAGGVSSNGQPGNPNQRLVRSTRKWNRPLANKPQDFQIRVRIIEGRQLPGNNIKPVVKVNVCGQTHRTRIRRGNNPFFDEMFFYNVNMLPLDLFDQSISFRVYDSFSLRADSLMGDFKVAIGFIYDGPDHSVMRKWLLLNDPDDYSSGARGYLKVSMFIVGTGDEPPVEKRDVSDDQDDIESNLLMPAGVTLRWVTLSLKVFRAEDIPQMDDAFAQSVKDMFGGDGNKKNLVDPFVEARFAGKKLCTQVIEKNANPEWNQMLNLQVKFPSMCEQIKLTIFDWDRLTRNDSIGTTYLNLGKIASSGGEIEDEHAGYGFSQSRKTGESEVGFLPAFGPCYVNLYGSPREFTGLPDPYEELNYGKGEGVAYRGRILVELSTKLEGKPDKTVDAIPSDDILVAQKYQRRRKYCLCAVFHSASMLQEPGEPIQFEVSIGNYGNKLDTTCKPLSSTTQYSCAVFDGNHYYYLPWADIKPVVVITSFWEDISHRLDAVNIILYISERLQSNITAMKTAILAKASDNRLAEIWLRLVNQLIDDLDRFKVPDLEGQSNLTALDIQIKKLRDNALQTIMEGADRMRDELADIKNTLVDIEGWLDKLKQLADEPQNSMPDVIIWMLRGETRVAYSRIPAHQLLYSTYSEQACGQFCGRTRTILMQYPMDKNKGLKVPVQIRVNVWLGLSAHEKKFNTFSEGTFSVFAELYENQAYMLGKWGTTGLGLRHKYSDVTGKLKLKQEYFMPPRGWEWEGEWFIDPEKGLLTEADAGHTEFIDEVFQNETRFPGGEWKPAAEPYADVNGEKTQNPGEMECPAGWSWEDEWAVDDNRAVDEKGWEYGITIPPDEKPKSWVPAEKMYHVHRRRRVVRPRKRSAAGTTAEKRDQGDPEGWEFSSLIGWKFHRKVRSTDTIRRRRWRRKMAPADRLGASAIFKLEGALGVDTDEKRKDEKVDASKPFGANTPTVSCSFDRSHVYHLRIYIYQARNLVAMDKDSFSDPYAHVSFLHMSQTTETMKATLNPTWDQTLIFHNMEIYGDPQNIAHYPPDVVLEFYDNDQVGKHELLGRSMCVPLVKLNPGMDQTPQLLWSPITHKGRRAGEVLVAAELILTDKGIGMDLPLVPPKRAENLYMVPQGIRPVVQLMAIEILAWGLRNMKTYQLATVSSPSLVVECGGEVVQSAVIKNMKKSPNFPGSVLFLKVLLPKEEMYTPPIVLKVIDHRPFGRKPVVGQCTIDTLEEFRCDPYIIQKSSMSSKGNCCLYRTLTTREKETVDWWSKFYASIGDQEKCRPYLQKGYDTLKVYDNELEEIPEFKQLTDFCRTFKLKRGKNEDGDDDPSVVGEFKGSFKVYPLSDDPGVALPPRQFRELPKSGPQECLVRIYVVRGIDLQPKDNNGQCDPYMKIALGKKSIEDRDNYLPNTTNPVFGRMFEMTCFLPEDKDLKISVYDYDLLSRDEKVGETVIDLENRFLSRFGSYYFFLLSGINQWRDQLKPSQILQNLARLKGVPPPMTEDNGNTLSFNGEQYTLAQFVCLFSWMPGMEEDKQKTDVHYRSLDGDGNFNWRFIFGFEYLPAEQLCLVSKKEHFWSLDKTEFRIPPKLIVQIWDNDKFSLDDYLGTVELDLCNLTPPAKTPEKCSLGMMEVILDAEPHKSDLTNSLFAQQSVRGWWPCVIEQDGKEVLGGKVEMTLEIVAENEVDGKPAGKGRDEPNMNPKLDFPNRPDTSFFWFTNPCKTMKFILCRKFKCMFIGLILLILVLLFIGILLYSLPVRTNRRRIEGQIVLNKIPIKEINR